MEIIAHENQEKQTQSLKEHSEGAYLEIKNISERLGLSNCLQLAAFLHDGGKASDNFQTYLKRAAAGERNLSHVNHSSAGAQFLLSLTNQLNTSFQSITKLFLSQTIVSHHGLNDFVSLLGVNKLYQRCYPEKDLDMDHVQSYLNETYDQAQFVQLFTKASEEIKSYILSFNETAQEKKSAMFYFGALQRLLISLLIHGDREDTRNFMVGTKTIHYQEDSIWEDASIKLEAYIEDLHQNAKDTKINILRATISDQCKEKGKLSPGIYRLSCPTGSGKTLASLRYALEHAKRYHKRHIIYVAPYKTILEQNADVIRRFFSESSVLEHHSNIIPSEYTEYTYFSSSWNKPVIVTTAVRLFDVLFSDRTTDVRRFHQLADSILLLDEVQNIPIKIVYMFNEMMNFIANSCAATVVLCTATQPLLERVAFPIQLSKHPDIIEQSQQFDESFKRVHIIDASQEGGYSMQDLSNFIFEKLTQGKSMLTILNTKAEVLHLYKACLDHHEMNNVEMYHLSTSMCPQHRNHMLNKMKERIGQHKTVLCFATNLIEAGVDISFNVVIRSLCGLDSILQSAGRCNRNGELAEMGTLYLINSNEESIDKLIDVKKGRDITRSLLTQMHAEGCGSNVDALFSNDSVTRYYERYFFDRRCAMSYRVNIDGQDVALFKLLSDWLEQKPKQEQCFDIYLSQALKTAGHWFQTIDSNTIGVLVPYGEGKKLISLFQSQMPDGEKYALLDKVQRYTVNVYERTYKELVQKGMLVQLEFNGMLCLRDGYYKEDTGLEFDKDMEYMEV